METLLTNSRMGDNQKTKEWGLFGLRKLVEYGGIFLAAWQLGIPAANDWHEERTEAYMDEHKSDKPFRELTGEEMGVRSDRVHMAIGSWFAEYNLLKSEFYGILPHIKHEVECVTPRLIIKEGKEFWIAEDGEEYRVYRNELGEGVFFREGAWHRIYN